MSRIPIYGMLNVFSSSNWYEFLCKTINPLMDQAKFGMEFVIFLLLVIVHIKEVNTSLERRFQFKSEHEGCLNFFLYVASVLISNKVKWMFMHLWCRNKIKDNRSFWHHPLFFSSINGLVRWKRGSLWEHTFYFT